MVMLKFQHLNKYTKTQINLGSFQNSIGINTFLQQLYRLMVQRDYFYSAHSNK